MQSIKFFMASLILMASFLVQAEESAVDKTKDSAVELWNNAKEASIELAGKASNKVSEVGSKASEASSKAAKNVKETGVIVWDAMKEAGAATAASAKKGAEKIRQLGDGKECTEDSSLCYKDKE